ncbi:MAG: hypothetical protein E7659_03255 [Ruminococcaceae bacterium]|nr:hypothetical protein [Oscillospiraceae bacterium]
MTTKLTGTALECYILTGLNIKDMYDEELYGAQILKNVPSSVSIDGPTLYATIDKLAAEGKITKRAAVQNGVYCEPCKITPLGKDWLKSFLEYIEK